MSASRSQREAPKRVVDETRRLYANLLSKPLDERQLARPTFKLMQEVVKDLITETRLLRQEFNATDFEHTANPKSAWDKPRRCHFLQRLIDFVANNEQPVVGCVASKLVAGLEPVKCNELLQALAKIATSRKQDYSKSRTFTKAAEPAASGPARSGKRDSASGSQAASRALSRHSSATRQAGKEEPAQPSESRQDSRRLSSKRAEVPSGPLRKSPSSSITARRMSPSATDDYELLQRTSIGDIESVKEQESSSETILAGGRATLESGLLTSDSDMSRNLQLLRNNLRAFQRVIGDVEHLQDQLFLRLLQQDA